MTNLKVLRTTGKEKDFLESEEKVIHLFIASMETTNTTDHELGDLLTTTESDSRFALLVKESVGSKIFTSALRVALLNLLNHLKEAKLNTNTILISKFQFSNQKEEETFICALKEFLMLHFDNLFDENEEFENTLNIVISDYKS